MKLEEAKERVDAILAAAGDPEKAHGMEDALYEDFIRYVAKGMNQFHAQKLAKEILRTKTSDFPRWCA